jgi:hypothetical protein
MFQQPKKLLRKEPFSCRSQYHEAISWGRSTPSFISAPLPPWPPNLSDPSEALRGWSRGTPLNGSGASCKFRTPGREEFHQLNCQILCALVHLNDRQLSPIWRQCSATQIRQNVIRSLNLSQFGTSGLRSQRCQSGYFYPKAMILCTFDARETLA